MPDQKSNLKKIKKIYLLVRPGFLSRDYENNKDSGENIESPEYVEKIFIRYKQKINEISRDEILIIFLPENTSELKKQLSGESSLPENLQYSKFIKDIKITLGDRLVVINVSSDKQANGEIMKEAVEKIKNILEARGYIFDSATQSEAFGEMLGACVEYYTEEFNKAANLETQTIIDLAATDFDSQFDGKPSVEAMSRETKNQRFKYSTKF